MGHGIKGRFLNSAAITRRIGDLPTTIICNGMSELGAAGLDGNSGSGAGESEVRRRCEQEMQLSAGRAGFRRSATEDFPEDDHLPWPPWITEFRE
jgi:hypothetical protein